MMDSLKGKKKNHKAVYGIGAVFILAAGILIGSFTGEDFNSIIQSRLVTVNNTVAAADTEVQTEEDINVEAGSVYIVIKDEGVYIRETPKKGEEVIGSVPYGDQVTLTGETHNNWVQINYSPDGTDENITGWVRFKNLSNVSESGGELKDEDLKTTKMSEEQIQEGATELFNNLIDYSVSDTGKFDNLFIGTSQEDLRTWQDFFAGIYNEHYAKQIVKVVLSQDPYYQIYTCCYTVAGTAPNTSMSNNTANFIMSLTDEGWKVNNAEEALLAIDTPENYILMLPEDVAEAYNAGRNAQAFGYGSLLDDTTVFEGCFDTSLAYLSQNEDGSVDAFFWLVNGTSGAISVNQITITVTDDTLGVVLDQTVPCSEMVNAGYSKLVQFHFEPEQVLTGTQTWTTMQSSAGYRY